MPIGPDFPWLPGQRRALAGLLVILCVGLGIRYACRPVFLDDPLPKIGPAAASIDSLLDPNRATMQELSAIPGLGEKRAQEIVDYRERWLSNHPELPAFATADDLRNIKGIGPATVANMLPFLTFPAPSTTRPAGRISPMAGQPD